MNIYQLRKTINREEVDYQQLMSALDAYSRPREKVSAWLKSGELIRVKKGLYVFGEEAAQHPYSHAVLANLIYGPSAVSLTYALSHYGLIPERVNVITSITSKRNKAFETPIGNFTYRYLSDKKYSIGIKIDDHVKESPFLIAMPEKALCDHIYLTDKSVLLKSTKDVKSYLLHDLRIDENSLFKLKSNMLTQISNIYGDERLQILTKFIREWKRNA